MRLLTALAMLGLWGVAVVRGWDIGWFAYARASIAASHEAPTESMDRWIGVPGLNEAALEASLGRMADATDIDGARRRENDLTAIVSVRPLSARNWLSLAGMRLVTGEPYEKVLDALAMSSLTGPNEGSVMLQRAIFGLLQWENLPGEARSRTIGDLAGVILGTSVRDDEILPARNVLRAKSVETREEIAGLLSAAGVSATELGRMGL